MKTELCGYCGEPTWPLRDGGAYTSKDGITYHSADCWPRARERLTGEPFITCKECGKAEGGTWVEETASRLREKSLCFFCNFWDKWVERDRDDPLSVRINGQHYHIADEAAKGMRGFGGRRFALRFFDGREATSTNLWSQGEIPKHFKERLPDNAEWLT